jgi:hypothetical protein
MRAPESHGRVGRGGNERGVVLCQDDVVDPMTMGLNLGFEAGRTGLLVRRRCVFRGRRGGKREVEIPGTDDAVAACGVSGREGIILVSVQPTCKGSLVPGRSRPQTWQQFRSRS